LKIFEPTLPNINECRPSCCNKTQFLTNYLSVATMSSYLKIRLRYKVLELFILFTQTALSLLLHKINKNCVQVHGDQPVELLLAAMTFGSCRERTSRRLRLPVNSADPCNCGCYGSLRALNTALRRLHTIH